MFAIFEDGSHQHQVQVGDRLTVDYREAAAEGDSLTFDRVLLANDGESSSIGKPMIEGAAVETEVLEQTKGKKLEIVKFRRRKNSRTHTGHRQKYTSVRVTGITVPGMVFTAPPADEPVAAAAEPEAAAADTEAAAEE
ncbi:50S ribosomal protein L21 [Symmachiella dynata]|uniref:Large ribosomal subunit protein bL21 n=1 Tax=Symmachiella dynata TaxID=2527995 RepID=A0A517ZIH0_9PLAN|nr:50S ribosomal protein L21 [Symmachiella dynata]QDU42262.1 50S ribosomal protein L21 [Symmachiella dynata]